MTQKLCKEDLHSFFQYFLELANTLRCSFVYQAERRGEAHVGENV